VKKDTLEIIYLCMIILFVFILVLGFVIWSMKNNEDMENPKLYQHIHCNSDDYFCNEYTPNGYYNKIGETPIDWMYYIVCYTIFFILIILSIICFFW
jgi:TRAP-type C4-dicarboxylate transport system permease small subunit